jgi:hypothetical protein
MPWANWNGNREEPSRWTTEYCGAGDGAGGGVADAQLLRSMCPVEGRAWDPESPDPVAGSGLGELAALAIVQRSGGR